MIRIRSAVVAIAAATLTLTACGQSGSPTSSAPGGSSTGPAPTFEVASDVSLPDSPTLAKAKAAGTLTVGVKFDQPGLGQLPAGQSTPQGFDIEIATMLAANLGFAPDKIKFVETVSANREPFLQNGTVDMIVADLHDQRQAQAGRRLRRPLLPGRAGPPGRRGQHRDHRAAGPGGQEGVLRGRLHAGAAHQV